MQSVDVGFTHVAFTVRCLASSIDFYTRYTAMTVIHQREPDLPSARKVAWLSDRTRPFALVLVQSDDPADTPLGPFGHLGVAWSIRVFMFHSSLFLFLRSGTKKTLRTDIV